MQKLCLEMLALVTELLDLFILISGSRPANSKPGRDLMLLFSSFHCDPRIS